MQEKKETQASMWSSTRQEPSRGAKAREPKNVSFQPASESCRFRADAKHATCRRRPIRDSGGFLLPVSRTTHGAPCRAGQQGLRSLVLSTQDAFSFPCPSCDVAVRVLSVRERCALLAGVLCRLEDPKTNRQQTTWCRKTPQRKLSNSVS